MPWLGTLAAPGQRWVVVWGRTLDFRRFLLPLRALRCAGSWVPAGGRVLVTLLRLLLLPGQFRGSLDDVGPGK